MTSLAKKEDGLKKRHAELGHEELTACETEFVDNARKLVPKVGFEDTARGVTAC